MLKVRITNPEKAPTSVEELEELLALLEGGDEVEDPEVYDEEEDPEEYDWMEDLHSDLEGERWGRNDLERFEFSGLVLSKVQRDWITLNF